MIIWPKISIVIPAHNEEKNIGSCLRSIFEQDYPKNKLDIIVVDDSSNDQTALIARQFGVKVIKTRVGHAEFAKISGFKKAAGELVMYLDADIELISRTWFKQMVLPLTENKEIVGSFTRYYSKNGDNAFRRYMCFDPLQRDGLFQFLTSRLEESIVKKEKEYFVCEYKLRKIPPTGLCLYRRKELMPLLKNKEAFMELDLLVILVKKDRNLFAYVPTAGLYHLYAGSLKELLQKRKHNLINVYFLHVHDELYTWIDWGNPWQVLRLCLWTIYANLFIPSLITGIYKSLKYRDWAGLYEPIVNLLVTDIMVWYVLTDKGGKKLIFNYEYQ